MRFDELKLNAAIYRVRQALEKDGEQLRSDTWYHERAVELCRAIAEELVTERNPYWLRTFESYGKQNYCDEAKTLRKNDIIAALYQAGQTACFYAGRGLGECSEDVDLDRIRAGAEYSIANCIITCSKHNRSRNNKSLEDFLCPTLPRGTEATS